MRSLLLIPLLFLFPGVAHAESSTTVVNQSITNSNSKTDVYTNVNGVIQEYHSDTGGSVTVTNDGKNPKVIVNNQTQTNSKTTVTPSPTPSQTEAQIRARIASEEAKIKAKMEEAKKKLEEKKKVLSATSFDLNKFLQDLFNRIFHR